MPNFNLAPISTNKRNLLLLLLAKRLVRHFPTEEYYSIVRIPHIICPPPATIDENVEECVVVFSKEENFHTAVYVSAGQCLSVPIAGIDIEIRKGLW